MSKKKKVKGNPSRRRKFYQIEKLVYMKEYETPKTGNCMDYHTAIISYHLISWKDNPMLKINNAL